MKPSGSPEEFHPWKSLCVLLLAGFVLGILVHYLRDFRVVDDRGGRTFDKAGSGGEKTSEEGGRDTVVSRGSGDGKDSGEVGHRGFLPEKFSPTEPDRKIRGRIAVLEEAIDGGMRPLERVLAYLESGRDGSPLAEGWTEADFQDPALLSQTLSRKSGVTAVHLRQRLGGLEVYNANLNANVSKDGSILSVHNGFLQNANSLITTSSPVLEARAAVQEAARHAFVAFDGADSLEVQSEEKGAAREIRFEGGSLSQDPIPAKLVFVAISNREIRLAWNLVLHLNDGQRWLDMNIDAENGALLSQANWYASADYRVFAFPLEHPDDGGRTLESDPHDASASPYGWHDTDGNAGAEFTDTRGNNVEAQEDVDRNNTGGRRPDGGAGLVFDESLDLGQAPDAYEEAATTNLFYWNNVIHDILWFHGFDEISGNFQRNNYGNGGIGGDPVMADAQDGSGINNANFGTPPEGSTPRMQMFVWTQANPDRDSDLENTIIAHEYGHGVSNRLTGGPFNSSALVQTQSRAMGEGWSDWFALVLTAEAGETAVTPRGIGTYVKNQPATGLGIRPYRYSTDLAENPLTFGDIRGNSLSIPHGIGTVWCAALWEVYWNLVAEYGWDPDLYRGTGGNNVALDLVIEGMKLQPENPTYLEARDAILLADQVLNDGANVDLLWQAFAKRGMGISADDGGNARTLNVTEAFDVPDEGISIDDVTFTETDSGSFLASFTVRLDFAGQETITVDWATEDGTAFATSDYSTSSGTVTFPPGDVEETIVVEIFGDSDPEEDEAFVVQLSNPVEAYLADDVAAGTIENDDYIPPVITGSLTAGGNVGSPFSYTVTASNSPRTFSISGEPEGMTIDPETGVISWMPNEIGMVSLQIVASNPAGSDVETLVVDVEQEALLTAIDSEPRPITTSPTPWFPQTGTTHDGSDAAQSGSIGNIQSSSMEIEVEGPEVIVFWWKVSSELQYDFLEFIVDGEKIDSISGGVDWTQVFHTLPEGTHTIEWRYIKDESVAEGSDAGWVDEFDTVGDDPRPFVTSASTAFGYLDRSFEYQITTSQPATEFSSSPLPAGLSLNTETGLISGTPLSSGITEVVVTATNGSGSRQRTVTITNFDLIPVPYSDSFESGAFSSHWIISGEGPNRTQVTQENSPADGDWHVTMDSSDSGKLARNELTMAVDISGRDFLELNFWAREYSDESNEPPASPFSSDTNFDGVAISPDGLNWYEVQGLREEVSSTYRRYSLNLISEISSLGLSLSGIYQIRFVQFDDYTINSGSILSDGIGIDDVEVSGSPAISIPVLSTESDSGVDDADQITNVTTPAFSGTGSAAVSFELVSNIQGTIATGLIGDNGLWSATVEELEEGVHEITAVANGQTISASLSVEVDTTPPSLTLDKASGQADPAMGGPIGFEITFSESIDSFSENDVDVSGTGVGDLVLSGGPSEYQLTVPTTATEGFVTVGIPVGTVSDSAGNVMTEATIVDDTVVLDAHGNLGSPTSISFTEDRAGASGWIEGPDVDAFSFTISGQRIVRIFTTGSLDTRGELRDSLGVLLNDPATDGDAGAGSNFRFVKSLPTGDYSVSVTSDAGNGGYELFVEILANLPVQPDLWAGNVGNGIYGSIAGQTTSLVSRKGRRVASSVMVENDGEVTDRIFLSGPRGTGIFRVLYVSPLNGNISAGLISGSHTIGEMEPAQAGYPVSVQVIPKKKKLRRKVVRNGKREIRYRVRRYSMLFHAVSAQSASGYDNAAIRIRTRRR